MDGITNSMDMSLSKMMKDRETWHVAAHGVTKSWTRLSNNYIYIYMCVFVCVYIYKIFLGGTVVKISCQCKG